MGRYGPTVAVPRILETYRRLGINQSFFIPGWCIETYPETVEAILKGGHEIGHHGYLHEDPIDAPDQRAWFEKALESYQRYCGGQPVGYRAPVYNVNQQVVDLLIEYGFRYDSSMMADDIPYRLQTKDGGLWEMPVHWGTDDWPPFAHTPKLANDAGEITVWPSSVLGKFDAAYTAGDFHVDCTSVPDRPIGAVVKQVETWLETTLATKDVWFARLDQIADHLDQLVARGEYTPRRDTLPYYTEPVWRSE